MYQECIKSTSTETVTLNRNQLEAILQLVQQFNGIVIKEDAAGRRSRRDEGEADDEEKKKKKKKMMKRIDTNGGHHKYSLNDGVTRGTSPKGSVVSGHLGTTNTDQKRKKETFVSKEEEEETPRVASTSSFGRKRFPHHNSNLDITQSHLFPSMSPSMSQQQTSVSMYQLNDTKLDVLKQTISTENLNNDTNQQQFRRCNLLTGGNELTNYDLKRKKMIEYQEMLDEQRREKERRLKEEKEKIEKEEAALEARYQKQQERMKREYEEEQQKMIQKKEIAERKRLAVVEAIQKTPIIKRRAHAGHKSDTISIMSMDGTSLGSHGSGSTFTLGTIGSNEEGNNLGVSGNIEGASLGVRSNSMNLNNNSNSVASQGYETVGQLVHSQVKYIFGGHPDMVGMYQSNVSRNQVERPSRRRMINAKDEEEEDKKKEIFPSSSASHSGTTSVSSSSAPSSATSSSSSSSLVTQVMNVSNERVERNGSREREERRSRRREDDDLSETLLMNYSAKDAARRHEGRRRGSKDVEINGEKEHRSVSTQTEIQLLYEWFNELSRREEGETLRKQEEAEERQKRKEKDVLIETEARRQKNCSRNSVGKSKSSSSSNPIILSSAKREGSSKRETDRYRNEDAKNRRYSLSPTPRRVHVRYPITSSKRDEEDEKNISRTSSKRSFSSPRVNTRSSSFASPRMSPSPTSPTTTVTTTSRTSSSKSLVTFPSPPLPFPSKDGLTKRRTAAAKDAVSVPTKRGQWKRDPNAATWKPVGDVIEKSTKTTNYNHDLRKFNTNLVMNSVINEVKPLIRPAYGRKNTFK